MVTGTDSCEGLLSDLPTINTDSFRISTTSSSKLSPSKRNKNSIYPTIPDTQNEQRIVNEPKPQVTLNYLRVRGGQYKRLSQKEKNHAKRRKVNCVKAQP